MVGRTQEEEEEGLVGREELELEAEVVVVVVVVVRAEMGLLVGLVCDHCCLFHSSAGTQTDHSGWSVEERRAEAHMTAEAADDADGQAEGEDGAVEDVAEEDVAVEDGAAEEAELELGDGQERGHGQGVDEACQGGV